MSVVPVLSRDEPVSTLKDGSLETKEPAMLTDIGHTAAGFKDEESNLSEKQVEEIAEHDPFLVIWDETDPENPLSWSWGKRWGITAAAGLLVLNATFSSTAPTGITFQLIDEWHIGITEASLQISLFVAGYVVGPILWGPLSERIGRRKTLLYGFIPFTVLQIGCALSPVLASLVILRFLAGCFAASVIVVAGTTIADMFPPSHLGLGMAIFTLAPTAGPALGPMISGYISVTGASWRILYWAMLGFAGACSLMLWFLVPETYVVTLLGRKAARIRAETGDNRYQTIYERKAKKVSRGRLVYDLLASPFIMLASEPMLLAITLSTAQTYGCMYLLFSALPTVFVTNHGFNLGEEGLVFISFFLGSCLTTVTIIVYVNPQYAKLCKTLAPNRAPPEARLPMAMVSSVLYFIAFFILAFTSAPNISYWGPIVGLFFIGGCSLANFMPLLSYLVDMYTIRAATALSANMIVRSLFAAIFPLFAEKMYTSKLGVKWSSFLLGCIAILPAPIPFLFYRYGPVLRAKSKFAASQ